MSAGAERFNMNCQIVGDKARVAMVGSDGTEILMILPFYAPNHSESEADTAVMNEAEIRMKAALLALISKNWPRQDD